MRHFEDFAVGDVHTVGEYLVTREEIVAFAEKWDPQPFHTDPEAALSSVFKGLIAAGCHVFSISILLQNDPKIRSQVLAGFGWDQVRFGHPVRPGDRLSLTVECLEKRVSRSRPDAGIVRNLIIVRNQDGKSVLTYYDTILVGRRADYDQEASQIT